MRILVISNAAWDDRNSVGNTMSNWFSGIGDYDVYSMYTRESFPDNHCSSHYYVVTVTDIFRNFFSWNRIGRKFEKADTPPQKEGRHIETRAIKNIKGWKRTFLAFCVEMLYSSRIWLNRNMKSYLSSVDPDIIFCFAIAEPFRYNIIRYMKKHSRAKIVLWIADDVYGQVFPAKSLLDKIYIKRYYKMFACADKLYGVSQMLCEEYSHKFNLPIEPLYKGCDLMACKNKVGNPIQIVYAGNLFYGRDNTLAALAKQLENNNKDGIKAQLQIYSTTSVDENVRQQLNIEGTSKLLGARPYDEIKKIMNQADIVLHVESFDEEQKKSVRLSFSTKIIDCLQSGTAMLVIGPKGIASVEYCRKISGVIVVDNLAKLSNILSVILSDREKLIQNAFSINVYAKKNHELSIVQNQLLSAFNKLLSV